VNLFATSPQWVVWVLVALLAAATIQDTVQLKISNLICGSVLLLAFVAMAESGLSLSLWQNVVVFTVVFAVGAFLFSRDFLGGGDVKLFAAVALWVDLPTALRLVGTILLAGGLLAVLIIVLRLVSPKSVASRVKTLQPKAGIPYGVAITAGTLLVVALSVSPAKEAPYIPINVPSKAPARAG
jgi:prepilin peptidase CpaA